MPPIIQFVFFYVVVPYCAVVSFGVFSCLEKRERAENQESKDCPLTKTRTWLTLFALLLVGILAFEKSISTINDFLTSEIICGSYFLTFLILIICASVLGAARLFLGAAKKNNSHALSSSVLISFGAAAVFSMLFISTLVVEFFKRAFLITH